MSFTLCIKQISSGDLKSSEEGKSLLDSAGRVKNKRTCYRYGTRLKILNQSRWMSAICIWKQMDMWEICIKELHEKWLPAV